MGGIVGYSIQCCRSMKIKRIISGILVSSMAFSIIGCSSKNAKVEFAPEVGSKYVCTMTDKTDFVVDREKVYSEVSTLSTNIDMKSKTEDGYVIGFSIKDFSRDLEQKDKKKGEGSIKRSDSKYRKIYDELDKLNIEYEVGNDGKVVAADLGGVDENIKALFGQDMLLQFLDVSMGTFAGTTFSEGGLAVYRNILGDGYLLKDLVQVDILQEQESDIKLSDIGAKIIIEDITDSFILVKLVGNKKIINTTYDLDMSYLVDRNSGIITKSECRLNIDNIKWQASNTNDRGEFTFVETSEWKEQ